MKSPSIKKKLARKAVKTTAKHSTHGTVSRLKRKPMRSATLLAIGALAGWTFARARAQPGSMASA